MNLQVARAVMLALLTGGIAPALAQDAAPTPAPDAASEGPLEEIVVTAQKRETKLQDTPISVAVLTAEGLANRQAISLASLSDALVGAEHRHPRRRRRGRRQPAGA
jgi:iron complex outermembrane receptor protein